MLSAILQEFEKVVKEKKVKNFTLLQNGLAEKTIIDLLSKINFPPNDRIMTYFNWKNGVKISYDKSICEFEIFPENIFLSIESAIENFTIYTYDRSWKKNWFPLFTNGGGDFLLFDFKDESLLLYSPSILLDSKPVKIYDSLSSYFKTAIMCFERSAYYVNSDKQVEMQNELVYGISKNENPNSLFWEMG